LCFGHPLLFFGDAVLCHIDFLLSTRDFSFGRSDLPLNGASSLWPGRAGVLLNEVFLRAP
jgi:hypothetical protein